MAQLRQCNLDASTTISVLVQPGKQHLWHRLHIGTLLFATQNVDKLRARCNDARSRIEDAHRSLWPGQRVPEHLPLQAGGGGEAPVLGTPTSVFIAWLLAMFTGYQGNLHGKQGAARVLQWLWNKVIRCQNNGVRLEHFVLKPDFTGAWQHEVVTDPTKWHAWTPDFFHRHIALTWAIDSMDENKPWVTGAGENPHICDFILWTFDAPASMRTTAPALYNTKMKLRSLGLYLLTQLASLLNDNIELVTTVVANLSGLKRRRLPQNEFWNMCAEVCDLLMHHEELLLPNSAKRSKKPCNIGLSISCTNKT